jgi:signal peptidase II
MKKKSGWLMWAGPGLLVLFLDRIVKWVHLLISGERGDMPGLFGFLPRQTVRNTGMAFGLFQGNSTVILIVSALLLAACFFLLRKTRPTGLAPVALSMIAGGALGNMIDRVLYGYVIDMFPFFGWFVFNVADVGVVAGAVLCGWSLLFRPSDWSAKEK